MCLSAYEFQWFNHTIYSVILKTKSKAYYPIITNWSVDEQLYYKEVEIVLRMCRNFNFIFPNCAGNSVCIDLWILTFGDFLFRSFLPFSVLASLLPAFSPTVDTILQNRRVWVHLSSLIKSNSIPDYSTENLFSGKYDQLAVEGFALPTRDCPYRLELPKTEWYSIYVWQHSIPNHCIKPAIVFN